MKVDNLAKNGNILVSPSRIFGQNVDAKQHFDG